MKLQEEYGADSILPTFMLRGKYNYFVTITPRTKKESELESIDAINDTMTTADSGVSSTVFPS